MTYLLLLVIGFILAAYIYGTRYSALNHVAEFILCLERIRPGKLFRYEHKNILARLQHFDLDAPDFGSDLLGSFRNHPMTLAGDLYISRERILPFIKRAYSPHDDYFRTTTDIIYDLLRDCDSIAAKKKFIVEFVICNKHMAEMMSVNVDFDLDVKDENAEEQTIDRLIDSFAKLDGTQFDEIVMLFLSFAKTGLISLTEAIKDKYIENASWRAIKSAGVVFILMLLLQVFFNLAWHIDLLSWFTKAIVGFFEVNDY